jgi:anti-anti-sigma regulatory factor
MIAEIAAASQEQSSGIEQVNRAISQMDQATQQNAALVEEAAAASESMEEQANHLTEIMEFFKLQETAATSTPERIAHAPPTAVERRATERPWSGTPSVRRPRVRRRCLPSGLRWPGVAGKNGRSFDPMALDPMALDPIALGPSLTIQEALHLKQELGGILSAGGTVHVDGAGVRSADTAGIQLLAAFSREAKMRNVEIIWRGASEVLLQSAARLGLSALLGLAAPDEAP